MRHSAFIAFGSNLGDRKARFDLALKALGELPETTITRLSHLYETEPKGLSDSGGRFLNAVVEIETELGPEELMRMLRNIEARLGKSHVHRSDQSRPIDLDLLLYGSLCVKNADLEIPHPRMNDRAFVLVPLAEIASHVVHPDLRCTISDLSRRMPQTDLAEVRVFGELSEHSDEA
jgi:2-amino-4-hydroxy-6-hydroxymethyldihydropteridine diphosphokinase